MTTTDEQRILARAEHRFERYRRKELAMRRERRASLPRPLNRWMAMSLADLFARLLRRR